MFRLRLGITRWCKNVRSRRLSRLLVIFVVFVGLVQFTFLLSLNDFVTISTCRVCKSVRLSRMHDIFFAVSFVFSQTPYKYCVFFLSEKIYIFLLCVFEFDYARNRSSFYRNNPTQFGWRELRSAEERWEEQWMGEGKTRASEWEREARKARWEEKEWRGGGRRGENVITLEREELKRKSAGEVKRSVEVKHVLCICCRSVSFFFCVTFSLLWCQPPYK